MTLPRELRSSYTEPEQATALPYGQLLTFAGVAVAGPSQLRAGKLDTWDFKQAVGAFTTGVTVVTTCDEAGTRLHHFRLGRSPLHAIECRSRNSKCDENGSQDSCKELRHARRSFPSDE